MNETLEYLQTFARFPFALQRFLQHRLTLDEAGQIVRERMEHREENFLRVVENSIYGYPRSPYLPLLKIAGCKLGDLRALVQQKGLEGTLRELREEGVYVTFEEFKGRVPLVRQGKTFRLKPKDFDNPFGTLSYESETGGSTGVPTRVGQNLEQKAALAPHRMIACAAHQVLDVPSAIWRGVLPDGSGINTLLHSARYRRLPRKWFSHIAPFDSKHWLRYGMATYYMLLVMRLLGARVPFPEFVPPDQAIVIARWIAATLRTNPRVLINTQVSRALRICVVAHQAGLDLSGSVFMLAGEPLTQAKTREITRAGASYFPAYGLVEAGRVALGCGQPIDHNDLHLLQDTFALITHPHRVAGVGVTVPAFNLTTLLANAPKVMLNFEMDDYGIVEERACGCEFAALGMNTHLREIFSYSKLTSEGVTLMGNDLVRILEEVLPARFGGTSLDYQLIEQENAQGLTRVDLVISPRVEIADEQKVIEIVLQELRAASGTGDATRIVWQSARSLQVRRAEPVWTARGKFNPLNIQRGLGD